MVHLRAPELVTVRIINNIIIIITSISIRESMFEFCLPHLSDVYINCVGQEVRVCDRYQFSSTQIKTKTISWKFFYCVCVSKRAASFTKENIICASVVEYSLVFHWFSNTVPNILTSFSNYSFHELCRISFNIPIFNSINSISTAFH